MAAVPRLLGLAHISLWLDEILGTLQTSGSFAQVWQALKIDGVHPPLWGLVNWLTQMVTDSELHRRLVPIAFAIVTILLLTDLVARQFGRATALYAAVIAAFSPLHVRYSQELRPYSLGLMMLVLAVWLVDRAVERGRTRDWVLFSVFLWLGFSSLYLVTAILLPALVLVLGSAKHKVERRRDLTRFSFSVTGACVAFAPWYGTIGEALAKVHELPATRWTLGLVVRRWHFLTAASNDGEAANVGSLGLAIIALVGAWTAAGSRPGRVALAGLLSGTVGIELLLVLDNHWTNGRYSISAWPFLVVILALGCQRLASVGKRWTRTKTPAIGFRVPLGALLAVLTVVGAEGLGLARYYDHGRPDWLGVARAVSRIVPSAQMVWVSNDWTRLSLAFYLAQLDAGTRPGLSSRVRVAGEPAELAANGSCGALVVAWLPERPELEELFELSPAQKRFPRTEARLVALPAESGPFSEDTWRCFPRELEAQSAERQPSLWGIPLRRGGLGARLEMVEEDAGRLPFGWSFAEKNRAGITFRWVVGHWAAVRRPSTGGRLHLRVWPYDDGQWLTVFRNRLPIAQFPLRRGAQDIDLDWPKPHVGASEEVVYLRFENIASRDRVSRPLAAGFDWIEIVESSSPSPSTSPF